MGRGKGEGLRTHWPLLAAHGELLDGRAGAQGPAAVRREALIEFWVRICATDLFVSRDFVVR